MKSSRKYRQRQESNCQSECLEKYIIAILQSEDAKNED